MQFNKVLLASAIGAAYVFGASAHAGNGSGEVTLVQIGDLHGHLIPHPSVRSDAAGKSEGGVARIYTLVENIRKANCNSTLVVNT